MGKIIYGTELSFSIKEKLKEDINRLKDENKRLPKLSVVLIGEDPASHTYVKGKQKACAEVGIISEVFLLDKNSSQKEVIEIIEKLNMDETVDGILVQLPVPKHLNKEEIIDTISIEKDVDGFSSVNIGQLQRGLDCFVPCTPAGIMCLLEDVKYDVAGKNIVVIGRSQLVGKPIAQLLLNHDATVTVCHSKTNNIKSITSQADALIVAVGCAHMVKKEWIKENAVIIDVGINRLEGKLVGDVDTQDVLDKCSMVSAVPKGVGPMTITMLLKNTYKAYVKREVYE